MISLSCATRFIIVSIILKRKLSDKVIENIFLRYCILKLVFMFQEKIKVHIYKLYKNCEREKDRNTQF